MKKLIVLIVAGFFSITLSAQEGFRLGVNMGVPTGDANVFSGWTSGLDVDYDWSVSDNINAGLSTGFTSYFARRTYSSYDYIPIVASIDYGISDKFYVGGDAGIGIGLNSGSSTDFLYRIQLRYLIRSNIDVSFRWNSLTTSIPIVNISDISDFGISFGYRF